MYQSEQAYFKITAVTPGPYTDTGKNNSSTRNKIVTIDDVLRYDDG